MEKIFFISNQWGENIEKFIGLANNLGYHIEKANNIESSNDSHLNLYNVSTTIGNSDDFTSSSHTHTHTFFPS